tara:strand:- start:429 stop:830 length:402 start_codon:yes stop_codon:yes gene_type:complete
MNINLILLFLLISLTLLVITAKKIIIKRSARKLKLISQLELEKKREIRNKLAQIDKANEESQRDDNLFMEKRKLKALKDNYFDLFYDEEKDLHKQRLIFKKESKWKGVIYYSDEKGDIYSISKDGSRIYIKVR